MVRDVTDTKQWHKKNKTLGVRRINNIDIALHGFFLSLTEKRLDFSTKKEELCQSNLQPYPRQLHVVHRMCDYIEGDAE